MNSDALSSARAIEQKEREGCVLVLNSLCSGQEAGKSKVAHSLFNLSITMHVQFVVKHTSWGFVGSRCPEFG